MRNIFLPNFGLHPNSVLGPCDAHSFWFAHKELDWKRLNFSMFYFRRPPTLGFELIIIASVHVLARVS